MNIKRKPDWLKIDIRSDKRYSAVNKSLKNNCLNTICVSGRCPNISECWNRGTATFMILGDICTRSCRFCNTKTGKPLAPNEEEPIKLASSIKELNIKHVVVTSVDRDDLEDGGANHWAKCIKAIKNSNKETKIEVLIPDFKGDIAMVDIVLNEKPDVVGHNIETVERLTKEARSAAKYHTSLKIINHIAKNNFVAKSSIMLGLGETETEIFDTMNDLLKNGCKILTIGQYLQPTTKHLEVAEYITPEKFQQYKQIALDKGFSFVESGPLVRSSYKAEQHKF